MNALWLVEGMVEDTLGAGFFRLAVVTESEVTLPTILPGEGKKLLEIDLVKRIECPLNYRPGTLPVPRQYTELHDEVKGKRYIRDDGKNWTQVKVEAT